MPKRCLPKQCRWWLYAQMTLLGYRVTTGTEKSCFVCEQFPNQMVQTQPAGTGEKQ